MSKKLRAIVPTAVMVNGERVVIQPGEELPDLGEHDEGELVRSGAAEDVTATAAAKKAEAKEAADAAAEIEAARKRVQAEAASTAAPAAKTAKAAK
jgi:hypothetical protein